MGSGLDYTAYLNVAGLGFVVAGTVLSVIAAHPTHLVTRSWFVALGPTERTPSEGELRTAAEIVQGACRASILWGVLGGLLGTVASLITAPSVGHALPGVAGALLTPSYAIGIRLMLLEPALAGLGRRIVRSRARSQLPGFAEDEVAAAQFDEADIETIEISDIDPIGRSGWYKRTGRRAPFTAVVMTTLCLLAAGTTYLILALEVR